MVPNPIEPSNPYYAAQLTEVTAQSTNGRVSFTSNKWDQSTPIYAIFDSGTTNTALPADVVAAIKLYLGATPYPLEGRPDYSVLPCDLATSETVFTFTFGGPNGPRINVPISDFIVPRDAVLGKLDPNFTDGTPACQLSIETSTSYLCTLGDTFLRSAYVVYDMDNRQIALAQSNLASAGANNIQDILPGPNGIPGLQTSLPALPWNTAALQALNAAATARANVHGPFNTGLVFSASHHRASVTPAGPAGALWTGAGLPTPSAALGGLARSGTNAVPTATGTALSHFPIERRVPAPIMPLIERVTGRGMPGMRVTMKTLGSALFGVCAWILV